MRISKQNSQDAEARKERIRAYQKRYREEHKEELYAKRRKDRQINPAKYRAYDIQYIINKSKKKRK